VDKRTGPFTKLHLYKKAVESVTPNTRPKTMHIHTFLDAAYMSPCNAKKDKTNANVLSTILFILNVEQILSDRWE